MVVYQLRLRNVIQNMVMGIITVEDRPTVGERYCGKMKFQNLDERYDVCSVGSSARNSAILTSPQYPQLNAVLIVTIFPLPISH
jgi:hypothetical protein